MAKVKRRIFAAIGEKSKIGTGWPMAIVTGNSVHDNKDWSVEILGCHCDEVPGTLSDSASTAQLIAGLLNAYYNGVDVSQKDDAEVIRMGKPLAELKIPHPANTELPF